MRVTRRYFLIALTLFPCMLYCRYGLSQDAVPGFPRNVDTSFIKDYKDRLTTRYYLLAQNTELLVSPRPGTNLTYQPNETGRFGLAAFFNWFGLGLSVGTRFFRKDPDIYGTTRSYDFRVNAYGKFLAVEGYVQYYRGFYMNYRLKEFKETFIIPGMSVVSLGIDGTYIYNFARFSIRAAFVQNEQQKRSAGSLMVKPTIRYYHISSDTGIIPGSVIDDYSVTHENLLSGDFTTLGLGPGYIYTFVFLKHFYFTAGAQMEMHWNIASYITTTGYRRESGFAFPGTVRLVLGYNSDTWFTGASYISTLFYMQPGLSDQGHFHYHLTQIRFWIGTRFDAFRRWNKKKS